VLDGLRKERLDCEDIAGLTAKRFGRGRSITQLLSIYEWPVRILQWNLNSMKICKS
jgi:hypothetical protein